MKMRWVVILAVVLLGSGCASTAHRTADRSHYNKQRHNAYPTHPRLGHLPSSDVPLVVNDRVLAWVDYFTGPNRARFERYLERSGRYMTLFRRVLRENGMPEDLVYVALIESGFSNRATSVAAAAGTWQFIQGTARRYGMAVNTWVDERRDPEKAVGAAARYLKDLHREFGDWYLALAGYNAGEGRVREAIARYGTKNFWELSAPGTNVFRAETREYVPKFIAAAILAKAPEQFGFHRINYQTPWQYELARVDSQTDLQVVSECAAVPLDTILDLNPDLRSGMTPPGSHDVRLPVGVAKQFRVAFAKVPREDRVRVAYHLVERHDTLPRIARRYGVSVRGIMAANGLRRPKDLHRGQQLLIPRGAGRGALPDVAVARGESRGARSVRGVREETALAAYRVRRGDTLAGIAARFGVTVADLRTWNGFGRRGGAKLLRGQRLQVRMSTPAAPEPAAVTTAGALPEGDTTEGTGSVSERLSTSGSSDTPAAPAVAVGERPQLYTVRRGDSWVKVAQRVGVSAKTLKSWNNGVGAVLRVGDRLRIRQGSVGEAEVAPIVTGAPMPAETPAPSADESATRTPVSQVESGTSDVLAISSPESPTPSMPIREAVAPAPVRVAKATRYVVRSGDTLGKIAARHGLSIDALKQRNRLNGRGSMIRPGQKLVVAGGGVVVAPRNRGMSDQLALAPTSARAPSPNRVIHRVRPGDTIWDLSRVYKVSPDQIKAWNNIPHGRLRPGQQLTIHVQPSSRS